MRRRVSRAPHLTRAIANGLAPAAEPQALSLSLDPDRELGMAFLGSVRFENSFDVWAANPRKGGDPKWVEVFSSRCIF